MNYFIIIARRVGNIDVLVGISRRGGKVVGVKDGVIGSLTDIAQVTVTDVIKLGKVGGGFEN